MQGVCLRILGRGLGNESGSNHTVQDAALEGRSFPLRAGRVKVYQHAPDHARFTDLRALGKEVAEQLYVDDFYPEMDHLKLTVLDPEISVSFTEIAGMSHTLAVMLSLNSKTERVRKLCGGVNKAAMEMVDTKKHKNWAVHGNVLVLAHESSLRKNTATEMCHEYQKVSVQGLKHLIGKCPKLEQGLDRTLRQLLTQPQANARGSSKPAAAPSVSTRRGGERETLAGAGPDERPMPTHVQTRGRQVASGLAAVELDQTRPRPLSVAALRPQSQSRSRLQGPRILSEPEPEAVAGPEVGRVEAIRNLPPPPPPPPAHSPREEQPAPASSSGRGSQLPTPAFPGLQETHPLASASACANEAGTEAAEMRETGDVTKKEEGGDQRSPRSDELAVRLAMVYHLKIKDKASLDMVDGVLTTCEELEPLQAFLRARNVRSRWACAHVFVHPTQFMDVMERFQGVPLQQGDIIVAGCYLKTVEWALRVREIDFQMEK